MPTAYIWESGKRISPFFDPIGETPYCNVPLATVQQDSLKRLGFDVRLISSLEEVTAGEPCLLIRDYCAWTHFALFHFLKEARAKGASCRFALENTVFIRMTRHLQTLVETPEGTGYDIWYLASAQDARRLDTLPLLPVKQKEHVHVIEVPDTFIGEKKIEIPIAAYQCLHIEHWAHILWANSYGIMGYWMQQFTDDRWRIGLRVLWGVLRGLFLLPFNLFTLSKPAFLKYHLLTSLNTIGKNCDIHPSAIIEASRIGDNVRIGANVIVRGSIIGDRAFLQDNAHVEGCVLGPGSSVSKNNTVFMCVLYEEASAGHILTQGDVFGRKVFTTGGGYLLDLSFEDEIKVMKGGKPVSCGSKFIGSAFGHGVRMGTGIWMQFGREIPSGTVFIRDPNEILSKIPADIEPGKTYIVRGGTLIPLEVVIEERRKSRL